MRRDPTKRNSMPLRTAGVGEKIGGVAGVLRLVTNRLDLPAELIAEMDRLRWVIEMFLCTFKQLLGCGHLFLDKHNGVEIQAYEVMIVREPGWASSGMTG